MRAGGRAITNDEIVQAVHLFNIHSVISSQFLALDRLKVCESLLSLDDLCMTVSLRNHERDVQ